MAVIPGAEGGPGPHPPLDVPEYRSTARRAPRQPLVLVPATLTETTGPVLGPLPVLPGDADLTAAGPRVPLGERIVVAGRVLDERGRPVAGTLVELWQANAAGRYRHERDRGTAPLDPNFAGVGRCLTGPDGGYRFTTIRPGAYPWGNHPDAWRPAHLHFSVLGPSFAHRLVTQMYFAGDPLLDLDPIARAVRDEAARARLLARLDLPTGETGRSLGYRFDLVLGGAAATPFEAG